MTHYLKHTAMEKRKMQRISLNSLNHLMLPYIIV